MSSVGPEVTEWLASFAAALGMPPPDDEEVDDLLALAGVAAHASARQAAPVACWMAARAGVDPAAARRLAGSIPATHRPPAT